MSARKPFVKNRQTALWLGVGFYVAGSLLLWDAYEQRGKQRPFITKLLPGA